MKKKIEVYTAITGGKDKPRNDIRVFDDYDKFHSPVMNAKAYKILPHKFLDCDISIWLDGNIFLNVSVQKLLDDFLQEYDMAVFNHNHCQSISYEVKWIKYALRNRPAWTREEVDRQMEYYTKIGFPDKTGMAMCGMIIRRHNKRVERFNEAWWAEICRWSQRDQLSFPVVLSRQPKLKVHFIKGNIKDHPYLNYVPHSHFKV